MSRLRILVSLLTLLMLSQIVEPASAQSAAPSPAWKPGTYIGTISINAYERVSEPPMEGVLHEEHSLEILMSTGSLQIFIGDLGTMQIKFSIPIKFKYLDWSQMADIGSGICEGQRSESTGRGTLRMLMPMLMTPAGDTFTGSASPFKVEAFCGGITRFGENCPTEVSGLDMRDQMEYGFKTMFQSSIRFEVKLDRDSLKAGYCYLEGYELEGDHVFDCTWYVERAINKNK